MRLFLMVVFLVATVWRLGVDWQATIGHGYAFRLGTLGGMISAHWPGPYASLVESLRSCGIPGAWNPMGALIMSMPVALVLLALAATAWMARPRERQRR
jgi:hypothetical protein